MVHIECVSTTRCDLNLRQRRRRWLLASHGGRLSVHLRIDSDWRNEWLRLGDLFPGGRASLLVSLGGRRDELDPQCVCAVCSALIPPPTQLSRCRHMALAISSLCFHCSKYVAKVTSPHGLTPGTVPYTMSCPHSPASASPPRLRHSAASLLSCTKRSLDRG